MMMPSELNVHAPVVGGFARKVGTAVLGGGVVGGDGVGSEVAGSAVVAVPGGVRRQQVSAQNWAMTELRQAASCTATSAAQSIPGLSVAPGSQPLGSTPGSIPGYKVGVHVDWRCQHVFGTAW